VQVSINGVVVMRPGVLWTCPIEDHRPLCNRLLQLAQEQQSSGIEVETPAERAQKVVTELRAKQRRAVQH